MARRKVSRRKTPARRKTTARRKTARKTTTRRRKAPARRKTKRKTTTRRRKAPARRKTTRRKTTTRRRKAPARRKTTKRRKSPKRRTTRRKTTKRRKSPKRRTARRKSPARRRTSRRRSVSRRKTASRRRSVSRRMSIKSAMKWTRTNLMKFEMMAALAGGLAISSSLPLLVEGALARVGINQTLTSGYKGAAVSLAAAGVGGYALYSLAGVSAQTAGLFTVAAMLPAALLALNQAGLTFLPTITVQNNPFSAAAQSGLYGILGNPGSVIDEPLFGGYHDGMHAGAHMPVCLLYTSPSPRD